MPIVIAPEPLPDDVGQPILSPSQLQALAQMAQALEAMNHQPDITSLTVPGVTVLPGQTQVIGLTDLRALVDEFLENRLARGNARGSLANYRRALGRLLDVCPRLPVTPAHIRQAITKPSWRQTTKFLVFTHLRAFFNELELLYGCPNPCRMIGKVDRGSSKTRVLSLEEMGAVYDATGVDAPKRHPRRFRERNELIVLLMIESGPRVSEIANIRTWDVSDGWVWLDGKTGPRLVPVSRELTDRMKALAQGDVVFTNLRKRPMTNRNVNHLVGGLMRTAGITGPKLGVHLMRHSFATNYLRNGGGVFYLQEIMGHRSLATTKRYVKLAGVDVAMDHSKTSLAKTLGLLSEEVGAVAQVVAHGRRRVGAVEVMRHQPCRPADTPARGGPGRRTPCRGPRRGRRPPGA